MIKTRMNGGRIPSRGVSFAAVLVVACLCMSGQAAAQSWIWWPAGGQNTQYGGAMTKSADYTGGYDKDPDANSLMPELVFADSTSDALNGGSGDTVTYWAILPYGANWYLWGRFYFPGAPGSNDGNSFWVSVDDGARKIFGNNKNYYQQWHWGGDGANEWGGLTPVSLGWLNSGWHKIVIEKREVNPIPPRIDAFLLTTESGYMPQDIHAAPALGVTIDNSTPTTPTAPQLSVAPSSLTFPATVVGETAPAQPVKLSNTGDAALNVTGVTLGGTNAADFTSGANASYSIQPGASATFSVGFAPKAAGTRTASISIASDGGNATVSLTGTATAPTTPTEPELAVTPASLTFPSTLVGETSPAQGIQLENTGDAALSVTAVELSGANASDFNTSASDTYSIQPGASATLNVTFTPQAEGTRTAAVTVSSNGGNATISLSGTGMEPSTPPAPDSNDVYVSAALAPDKQLYGAMTTSAEYTGGDDLDPNLDSLCSELLYANSRVSSWYSMTGDEAAYTITLPETGIWYLWGRFYYPGRPGTKDANSFVAAVDDGKWYKFGNKLDQFRRFHWDGNGKSETGDLQPVKLGRLTAGTHTLRIRKREIMPIPPRLDVMMMTMDANKVPADEEARAALGLGTPPPPQEPGISVSPTSLAFGKIEVGSTSTAKTFTVTNTGSAALSISTVDITGAQASNFTTNAAGAYSIDPAEAATFSVTFKPTAAGAASATLEISSNAPTGKATVALTGEGTETVEPGAISVDRTSLNFGAVTVGTTSSASTVNVSNTGGSEISISSISIGGAQANQFAYSAAAMPIKLAAEADTAVQVTFKPTAVRSASASLTIASSVGNKTVALTGTGEEQTQPPSGDGANEGSVMGTNLTGLADYSSEWPFVDAYKMSRAMWSASQWAWNDPRPLDLDANGWPKSLQDGQWAKTIIFWDLPNMYPSGEYVVLYEGEGTLVYEYAATKVSSTPGRDVIRVDASQGGFGVSIASTNPANYLRNIRVIMPGLESSYPNEIFNPTFLESIENYKVLRFMDWMETNGSNQVNWTDRPKPTDAQWTHHGAPLEIMCALANRLHADPWVCVPHRATDDYVRQMAALIENELDPSLRVWVEHSNEVWNWGFPQTSYASEMGLALGLSNDQYAAVFMYHVYRTLQIVDIFESVFGGTSRMVRVLGAQVAGSWWADQMLMYNNAAAHLDALAVAPYFGGYMGGSGDYSRIKSIGVEGTINELWSRALPETYGWIDACASVANKHGVELVAYEGGQHLVGVGAPMEDPVLNNIFDAVNRDPRMGNAYTDLLNYWRSKGGGMFVHFNNAMKFTKYGRWGAMEYLGQPRSQTPKYDALQNFIEANR